MHKSLSLFLLFVDFNSYSYDLKCSTMSLQYFFFLKSSAQARVMLHYKCSGLNCTHRFHYSI